LEITTKAIIAWQWLAQVARTSLAKADATVSTNKTINEVNKETKKLMKERGKLIRK